MRKVRLEHQRVLAQKIAGADGHRIAQIGELNIPAEIFARLFRDAAVEAFQLDVLIAQPLKVGAFQNMRRPARLVLCRDELQLGVTNEHAAEDHAQHNPGERVVLHRRFGRIAATRRLRSEEHTSELQSLMRSSYAVFCLKKKNEITRHDLEHTAYIAILT